jgi:hypothetical protein
VRQTELISHIGKFPRGLFDNNPVPNKKIKRQCCGTRMFIPDPDFYICRIPDPNTETKERDEKN